MCVCVCVAFEEPYFCVQFTKAQTTTLHTHVYIFTHKFKQNMLDMYLFLAFIFRACLPGLRHDELCIFHKTQTGIAKKNA